MEMLLDVEELLLETIEALELIEEEEKDIAASACSRALLLLPPTAEEGTLLFTPS